MVVDERLRILLDNPAALRLPIQDLSVPMSESAWASFLERFGAQLERLMLTQLEAVEQQLARLEFFKDCANPLSEAGVFVQLRQGRSPHEMEHFRILVQIMTIQSPDSSPTLCLTGRDGETGRGEREEGPMFHLIRAPGRVGGPPVTPGRAAHGPPYGYRSAPDLSAIRWNSTSRSRRRTGWGHTA